MGIQENFDIGWSKYNPNDLIKASNQQDVISSTAIFPSHNILALEAEDSPDRMSQIFSLIENNKELYRTALSYVVFLLLSNFIFHIRFF